MLDPLLPHQIDFNAPFWIGKQVVIDSRHIVDYPNSLFFALSGNKTDGHQFIQSLHEKGVQHFVVNASFNGQIPEQCLFRTNHVRDVLQQFAAYHRMQFTYPVIGITGSNGKTTLKECIYEMLHSDFNVIKSPKSYNSQIGVPLSIFGMSAENNLAIFEAGISQVDEMKHLQQIIRPTIGIFTNIGDAHSSGFDSQTQKLNEKLQLFSECDLIIYNNDIPQLDDYLHTINPNAEKLAWSYHKTKEANFHIVNVQNNHYLTGTYNQITYKCSIPFNNPAFIENTANAIVLMIYLNNTEHQIQEKVNSLSLNTARLSIKDGINDSLLIDDTYNNDFEGLRVALDFMNRQYQSSIHSRKTLILSDFQDTKTSSIYKKTLALLRANPVDRIILVGTQFKPYIDQCRLICHTTYYPSTLQLLEQIASIPFNKEVVLIKGARAYRFEQIINRLNKQIHQTQLEINTTHLIHNFHVFKKQLSPSTKVMAMVKASAYGSGSVQVARALSDQHVDYFGVAYTDEGIALRKGGITQPIMIMNSQLLDLALLMEYNLSPAIHNVQMLKGYIQGIEQLGSSDQVSVHIEINSGMNRLGFDEEEIDELIKLLSATPNLNIQGIFSHLAAADNKELDPFTEDQIACFNRSALQIEKALGIQPIKHILNSAGISRFSSAQFDMVRLGIGLYGFDFNQQLNGALQPVLTLKSTIAQIRYVKAGQSIGYDRAHITTTERRIAIVSIGYADGLLRQFSMGRAHVFIKNRPAPIVGNICMDMCFVDVSDLTDVHVGDEVIIFETVKQIAKLAEIANTIPYEILTHISDRIPRVFFEQ